MIKQQLDTIFALITEAAGEPPHRVGVLMSNGQTFAGTAYATGNDKLMRLDMDRIADAHLTKAIVTVWLDTDAIIAITSDGPIAAPTMTAGKTAEPETQEDMKT